MKRVVVALVILGVVGFVRAALFGNYGSKLKFGKDAAVYYKDGATEADASAVSKYLESTALGKTAFNVQLTKHDGKFQMRFVVKEGVDKDDATMNMLNVIGSSTSALALNGQPVVVEATDAHFRTLKTLPSLGLGKAIRVGNSDAAVFYTDAAGATSAKTIADWVNKLTNGDTSSFKLDKKGDTYELSNVVAAGADKAPDAEAKYGNLGNKVSEVLGGAKVAIVLCDSTLQPLRTIPMTGAAAPADASKEQPAASDAKAPAAGDQPAANDASSDKSDSASPSNSGDDQ